MHDVFGNVWLGFCLGVGIGLGMALARGIIGLFQR